MISKSCVLYLERFNGSWKVLIQGCFFTSHPFDSSGTVCTSTPHWVTQIAAGRLDEGNEEKDEVGKEEVEEMKMVAVGECSEAGRPRNIPQLPPS